MFCLTRRPSRKPYQDTSLPLGSGSSRQLGTSKPIIDRLNAELLKAVDEPEIKKLLAEQSFSSLASTPEEFTELIQRDLAKWTKVVKDSGIEERK